MPQVQRERCSTRLTETTTAAAAARSTAVQGSKRTEPFAHLKHPKLWMRAVHRHQGLDTFVHLREKRGIGETGIIIETGAMNLRNIRLKAWCGPREHHCRLRVPSVSEGCILVRLVNARRKHLRHKESTIQPHISVTSGKTPLESRCPDPPFPSRSWIFFCTASS